MYPKTQPKKTINFSTKLSNKIKFTQNSNKQYKVIIVKTATESEYVFIYLLKINL